MEPENVFRKAAFGDPRTAAQIQVAKRINTVALIGLIILLGSTFFYFIRLNNTKMALEDSKSQVEIQKDSLEMLQARQQRLLEELNSYKNNLSVQKQQSDSALQALVATVKANDMSGARSIVKRYDEDTPTFAGDEPDSRVVNLYIYRAPSASAKAVQAYLTDHGYQILRQEEFNKMEKWLTPSSTIEYFSEDDKALADQLRVELSRLTGSEFALQFTPTPNAADRPNWLNVTLIGEEGVQEIMQMNLPMQQKRR